ncbi:hypothetical protein PR003_g32435 [Phytophthora rubi]|uniref:Glucose-methanol-choline oxidoreductase C-terminal domain-containing protein n=1 Tax=Phytophthora rubi TaxID=129364 RepID=A0A6A3G337_9STRA|nr:hypothetical protein PR001_g33094 [Phytophthora rubi]KAE8952943.1 hypothetical protein PR002_g32530 [Phytophthora rubi]KAE9265517.1 hypothetical protein PR003_g32435 [Phytophthora rubi]
MAHNPNWFGRSSICMWELLGFRHLHVVDCTVYLLLPHTSIAATNCSTYVPISTQSKGLTTAAE